jgi:glycerophosphoryl diester phosphodiesterase
LIQLVGLEPEFADLTTVAGLRQVTGYAFGLGPHYSQLVEQGSGGVRLAPLTNRCHEAGLSLHPYTFRRDDLPPYVRTFDELLAFFFVEARVGGLFCDHPDIAVRVRAAALDVQ